MSAIWQRIADAVNDREDTPPEVEEIPELDTTDEAVRTLKAAGWTDAEISEISKTLKDH